MSKITLVSGKEVSSTDTVYWVRKEGLLIYEYRGFSNSSFPSQLREDEYTSEVFATPEEAETWRENYKERIRIMKEAKQEVIDRNLIKPKYYKGKSGQDVIDVSIDFDLCPIGQNIFKYIARAGKKDKEKELEDWCKAKEYIERKIKSLQK